MELPYDGVFAFIQGSLKSSLVKACMCTRWIPLFSDHEFRSIDRKMEEAGNEN